VYGIDVEDDSGRLGLGVLVHAVLEEAYRFDLPDWDGSGSPPRVGVPASLPPGERYQWLAVRYAELARGKYVLRSTYRARDLEDRLTGHELALHELFADAQRAEDADSRVAFVEHAFEVPLAEGIALRGKIDRVDRLPDGGIEVVDYKTGKRPGPWKIKDDVDRAERIAADPQTLAYGVAASLDPRLSALGPLRAMRYVFLREQLPDQDTLPEAVAAPLPLDEAREALLVLARAIQAEQFQPSPGSDCKRCPFSGICPAGEAADAEAE
jgi:RecB family exonuclease